MSFICGKHFTKILQKKNLQKMLFSNCNHITHVKVYFFRITLIRKIYRYHELEASFRKSTFSQPFSYLIFIDPLTIHFQQ